MSLFNRQIFLQRSCDAVGPPLVEVRLVQIGVAERLDLVYRQQVVDFDQVLFTVLFRPTLGHCVLDAAIDNAVSHREPIPSIVHLEMVDSELS